MIRSLHRLPGLVAAALLVVLALSGAALSVLPAANGSGGTGGATTLPTPWRDTDVGAVPVAGSASYSGATFTASGSGADVWGTSDAFHFVYQQLSGDGSIDARVASVQQADE